MTSTLNTEKTKTYPWIGECTGVAGDIIVVLFIREEYGIDLYREDGQPLDYRVSGWDEYLFHPTSITISSLEEKK